MRTSRHVYGLDIRKDALYMVCYSLDEAAVTSVAVHPFAFDGTGDRWWKHVAREIEKVVNDVNMKGSNVVCSLPFEKAIIKNFVYDADEDDIDGAIAWELEQHVLGGLEEYVYDYQEMPSPEGKGRRFFVVAYKAETVKRLADITRSHKLYPLAVDLDMFGLVNAYEANYSEGVNSPAVLAFLEGGRISLILTLRGMFVDFETMPAKLGAEQTSACVDALCNILARMQRAVPATFAETPVPIYGAGALLRSGAVAQALVQAIPGFQLFNPFKHIAVRIGKVPAEDIKKFSPELSVAVGLAVRGGVEIGT